MNDTKMILFIAVLSFAPLFASSQLKSHHHYNLPEIKCLDVNLPIAFSKIDFHVPAKKMPQAVTGKIEKLIIEFYLEYGGGVNEEYTKASDCYFNTLKVPFRNTELYLLILKTPVNNFVHVKLFVYDPVLNVISKKAIDYNIWAMYTFSMNDLIASNLRNEFIKSNPDICITGSELRLKRLWHNGTSNAVEDIRYQLKGVELKPIAQAMHYKD